jgi:uncharacterized protein YndB with AHSA1/START domain
MSDDATISAVGRKTAVRAELVLEIERVFEAPRALVFEMWIKAQHVQRWLAIDQFTVLGHGNAQLGVPQRIGMWSPVTGESWQTRQYREITPPSRLVFTHQWDGSAETLVSISFEEQGENRTLMRFRQSGFETANARDLHEAGWAESFDNFGQHAADYLREDAKLVPAGDPAPLVLEIERLFDAPRELVFRLWSAPEHIARWWGPKGYSLSHCEMDFREGGNWRFCMQPQDGAGHWIHGEYREIRPPGRLAFTYVNDADGQEMLVELDFLAEGEKTRLKFRQARFMTVLERNAHRYGWQLTFDIFVDYLRLYGEGRMTGSRLGWRQGEVADVPADLEKFGGNDAAR